MVLSDITSGYNIAENIYLHPKFNDLCGFNETEIESALKDITKELDLTEKSIRDSMNLMRSYYNGYSFSVKTKDLVYNPTLAIYFMKAFYEFQEYPEEMLDSNLATDEAKLRYVAQIPKGRQLLLDLVEENHQIVIPKLENRFGIKNMLSDISKDDTFMVSFLYYFGVLSLERRITKGKIKLKVPNLVMRGLYVERIQHLLLPEPADRDNGIHAAEELYTNGDIEPICEFIEQNYFKVFRNRDYIWANELTVKTAFLPLLYNDILYIMDSEKEIGRGYGDLTMIIRTDMRHFEIFDVLIEFKFVKLIDADLTGEEARKLSVKELKELPAMQIKMEEARNQTIQYGQALDEKYEDLRLKKYAVTSLGFERLWCEEV